MLDRRRPSSGTTFDEADLTEELLRAPPAIIYIDDAPLQDTCDAHELFVTSDGKDGARHQSRWSISGRCGG